MISFTNPFWLILTDSFLGLIVAALAVLMLLIIVREIVLQRRYERSKRIARDLRAFVSKHQITMADGGEPSEEDATKNEGTSRMPGGEESHAGRETP